jgi:YD repeat-containing protein
MKGYTPQFVPSRRFCSILLSCLIVFVGLVSGRVVAEDMTYHYDDAGRLIGVNYEGGRNISYIYDAGGNILKKLVSQIVDTDNDFMDDDFEKTHFTNLDRDGTLDYDKDGFSDLDEFWAGTLPKDNTSLLTIFDITLGGSRVSISWTSIIGKIYRVQYTDDLASPVWKELAGDVIADSETASKTDGVENGDIRRFYRVIVLQ